MANEISSQITATVQKQTRVSEPAVVQSASNRQESAAITGLSSNAPVSQVGTGPVKTDVEQAVSDINDYVQTVNRDLQFRVDEALPLGRSIVTVIDADTQETIREFPSEEAVALAHQLREQAAEEAEVKLEGLIISAQA